MQETKKDTLACGAVLATMLLTVACGAFVVGSDDSLRSAAAVSAAEAQHE